MIIEATERSIEWLFDRLYAARRTMQAVVPHIVEPTFVLLTKGEGHRHEIERRLYNHFVKRYGELAFNGKIEPDAATREITLIVLPEIGARLMLLDMEESKNVA